MPAFDDAAAGKNQETPTDWSNYGFGLGIAYAAYNQKNVESAGVYNGVVHIDKQQSGSASIWLELHNFINVTTSHNVTSGNGPFVAIQAGGSNNQTISAYAIGWMWGSKKQASQVSEKTLLTAQGPITIMDFQNNPQTVDAKLTKEANSVTPASSSPSVNIGIGISAMTIQTLGSGLQDGAALPAGETSLRYKTETSYGPIIMASFAF
jgi:hypothetical protein